MQGTENVRHPSPGTEPVDFHRELIRVVEWTPRAVTVTAVAAAYRYVALNPAPARLAARAEDWLWSSARALLGLGADRLTDFAPAPARPDPSFGSWRPIRLGRIPRPASRRFPTLSMSRPGILTTTRFRASGADDIKNARRRAALDIAFVFSLLDIH
jgi:hypothetical protein